MMTIKNKAFEIASEAKQHADNLSKELKKSHVLDKAKVTLDEVATRVLKAETPALKFMNLFAVGSLCSLMLSSFFTFGTYWGSAFTLSESSPAWLYIIAIVTMCSYLLGAKKVLSRSLTLVLLVTIFWRFYDVITESVIHTSSRSQNSYSLPIDEFGFGFYLFAFSLLMVFIAMVKPGYKENLPFWMTFIQK